MVSGELHFSWWIHLSMLLLAAAAALLAGVA